MNDRFVNNIFIKKSNTYKQSALSPLTEFADSGIASRITPLSSINDNRLQVNQYDNDDDESITIKNQSIQFNLSLINKRKLFLYILITEFVYLFYSLAILQYKKCEEYVQYSNCLITYLDHPSAIFIQTLEDGSAFQQMHQDMK